MIALSLKIDLSNTLLLACIIVDVMALNLTGVDLEVFFDINVAVNVLLFTFFVLPPFLLCLLCIVALVFAGKLNKKIRILLINIFAAEICNSLCYSVLYLGWPVVHLYNENNLCKVSLSLYLVSAVQKFTSGGIYAINVYIFIKHGEKKLKWSVITPYIIVSWILAVAAGVLPYLDDYGVTNYTGFCRVDTGSVTYILSVAIAVLTAFLLFGIELACCILTMVYITRNVLEENTDIKKAVAKVLAYLVVASVLSFMSGTVPNLLPIILIRAMNESHTVQLITVNYIIRMVSNMVAISTPIVAVALLKPVRAAIKMIWKQLFPRCDNTVYPNPQNSDNHP